MQIEQEFLVGARIGGQMLHGRLFRGIAVRTCLIRQMLASAGYGEPFLIEKALNLEDHLDVFATVQAASVGGFDRLEHGEFALPEAQDEGFGGSEASDFGDGKETLIRDLGGGLSSSRHSRGIV